MSGNEGSQRKSAAPQSRLTKYAGGQSLEVGAGFLVAEIYYFCHLGSQIAQGLARILGQQQCQNVKSNKGPALAIFAVKHLCAHLHSPLAKSLLAQSQSTAPDNLVRLNSLQLQGPKISQA